MTSPIHLEKPVLVVSIINFRTADLTVACLHSVLDDLDRTDDLGAQVVVVDNRSDDGSVERIETWIAEEAPDAPVSLEEMRRDPQAALSAVGGFLGLAEPLVWRAEQGRVNISAERIRRFPLYGLVVDNPVATALRRALVPQRLQMRERPTLPEAKRRELEALFAEDFAALCRIFPDRGDLAASYPFLTS